MRRRSKARKKMMAVVLSVAMMMSSISVAATEGSEIVEATEIGIDSHSEETTEASTAVVMEEEEVPAAASTSAEEKMGVGESEECFRTEEMVTEEALTVEETAKEEGTGEETTTEEETATEEELTTEEETTAIMKAEAFALAYDSSKIDVWDFGAEILDTDIYNNMLTADIMNDWYTVEDGTKGVNIASFTEGDLAFHDGGYPTAHRLRTTNTDVSRWDEKSLKGVDEASVYTGYIYSNKAATDAVNLTLEAQAGDIVTVVAASNGTDSEIVFRSEDGDKQSYIHSLGSSTAGVYQYYAAESGTYTIYSATEKLVVARIYREHTNAVMVSGSVSAPEELEDYTIVFTNTTTDAVTKAKVKDGTYRTTLHEQYSYDISLENANGYVITSVKNISLKKDAGNQKYDVTIDAVNLFDITGSITGMDEEALAKLQLSFETDKIFKPQVTLKDGKYTTQFETGVTYTIKAEGVNDYELAADMNKTVSATKDTVIDIAFAKKLVYAVTIQPVGATTQDLAEAEFIFTNLEEEGYEYRFTGTEGIELRDGVYSVVVENSGAFVQQLTSNLKVDGRAVTKSITFSSDIKEWIFTDASFTSGKYSQAGEHTYNGLTFTNGKSHGNTYLYSGTGIISVPVKGDCTVTVNSCYQYSFYFEEETEASVGQKTGSTGQIDSFSYNYKGGKGYVDITVLGTSYINSIVITESAEYKSRITVGASGCDYTTINDALDAVRNMDRTADERVTIEILPGDYEEMLVIDVPNITLKNASKNPSIETKNQGVDIDTNAVRITSYYGHGYTYYSMGNDCKYSDEILAVNKANGYASFENPGSGTTAGSYWNATVVVDADGFEAEGIIFENSFNQYVSKKAANDVIVAQSSAKEDKNAPRAGIEQGSTAVQDKSYVERAAALAITNNRTKVSFDYCKFIGRQDTLYGGTGVTAAFYDCSVYGGTDYIFGGMTAVFAKCDLVFNTSENQNDVGYITAAQTKSGRGMLMYNCTVTSTVPGVDTASEYPSKAGYFGRPWAANTGEAVFYNTVIEATDSHWYEDSASLIKPAGWLNTLSGESVLSAEYGTYEMAKDVDNQKARASWASTLTEPVLSDGTKISVEAFLGSWDAFAGKDMDIEMPTKKVDNKPVEEPDEPSTTTEFILDTTADLTAFAQGEKVDGDSQKAGTEDYFTLIYSAKTKVDSSSKSFEDGYAATQRVNFGGKVSTEKNAVKFTTGSAATVKVWWVEGGDDNRQITILDASGNTVATTEVTAAKNATVISILELTEAGTYYLGSTPNNNYIFKVEVTENAGGTTKPERADWASIEAPEITNIALNSEDAGKVDVTVKANIGYDGADKITVTMTDEKGEAAQIANSMKESSEVTVSLTPSASGIYTFSVKAVRDGEEDKVGAEEKQFTFSLPLTAPVITSATSMGNGTVEVEWDAVTEAEGYRITVDGTDIKLETAQLTVLVEGLEINQEYTFKVVAVRGEDASEAGSITAVTTESAQTKWAFSAFGQGVNLSNNGYEGNANDGSVRVYSTNGKGKLVPNTTDGLAFYYTEINPETTNFTLTATAKVNNWTFSNGQEGFGLMAADAVGTSGDSSVFWNNSYMASVTKVEYFWDGEKVSDAGDKISMKLGVGSQEKKGVTPDNITEALTLEDMSVFSTAMTTLETSCAAKGAGTYNLVGNYTNSSAPTGTLENTQTEFTLTIQKNNTGYFVSYTDAAGNTTTNKYYGTDVLNYLDEDTVYVGFYASRNADITFTDIQFTTIAPEDDAPAEQQQVTEVTPSYVVESAAVANQAAYDLVFRANADGALIIKDSTGSEVVNDDTVKANEKVVVPVTLALGNNKYTVTFTPNADYKPSEHEVLSSYETVTFEHSVLFRQYGEAGDALYVSPEGSVSGDGTKSNPLDIYTAVKYVQAGQTIVIMEGTYNLNRTVKVERGINGTKENMIYMVADPQASSRPVFDFGGKCAGMVLAGDYWYFKGFDVTRSADAQKGIQLSGDYNTLDQIQAYKNGNTGIQISRYLSSDSYEDWPSYNLILNCTSFENADKGYEDADGFAAKLTIGDGNVFDGCIAHHNADDGWDLFAKLETGAIGTVTIKNSVAYKNGYVLDENGNEVNAGNGNGFKMGGDSISGYHVLENSVAFFNKAKGIDSNSCPDIQVINSVTFNNESYNVAFYTNSAVNTDYCANGIISYRTDYKDQTENIKPKGTQDTNKIYGTDNFYWDAVSQTSMNKDGVTVSDDWFESLTFTGVGRNADGTICMNGFLKLTDKAQAGGSLGGTASGDVTIGDETDGKIETGIVPGTSTENTTNSSSGNVARNNSSTSGSSSTVTVSKTTVTIEESVTPLTAAPILPDGYTYEQVNVSKEGILRAELLNKYYGQKVYFAAIFGKDFGMTIDMQETGVIAADMKLSYTMVSMPAFAEGFDTVHAVANTRTGLPMNAMLHFNVGKEYVGKIAYIYMLSDDAASYQFVGAMNVNEIGNIAYKTDDFTDVMILIAK